MMIYVKTSSKKKNVTKKQQAEYDAWLNSVKTMPGISSRKIVTTKLVSTNTLPKLKAPPGRETPHYQSIATPGGNCTKPIHSKVYTGTAMKGIGTLHKSNAVPVFTDEDMVAQAAMRR
jgi:hypothetical protein